MKNVLILFLFPLLCLTQQTTTILDSNFEQALIDLGYDDILDNSVLTNNINTVSLLELSGKNIANLTGIEDFTELAYLYCYSNNISEIDMSSNLLLKHLYCGNNNITTINIANNYLLEFLSCDNNYLIDLDVSNNTLLESLICFDANLSDLDISNNPLLTNLSCNNNNLTTLDVSNNPELNLLNCFSNNLTDLDVSNNLQLEDLYCYDNNISELNISNNTGLMKLNCASNNISTLNTSYNSQLKNLNCSWNNISTLSISNNINIEQLSCYGNNLSELDLSNNSELKDLYCYLNNLTYLNVSNNTELNNLWCNDNNIECIRVWDVEYAIEQENCAENTNCFIKDSEAIWSLTCGCPDEYPISIVTTTGEWANEMNWGLWDYNTWTEDNGPVIENAIVFFQGENNDQTTQLETCLPSEGCYMIAAYDSYGDGWNGGYISVNINNTKSPVTYELVDGFWGYWPFTINAENCNWEIPGCTDSTALNYNSAANVDDGSCIIPNFFNWDNEQREYFLYVPENLPSNAPLVFALHGYWGEGADMLGLFANQADEHGFVVCYPSGLVDNFGVNHWNANFDESMTTIDDIGFLSNLAFYLQEEYDLNSEKTFTCGMSNGGFMSWSLACHAPEVFKAIASVTGTMSGPDWIDCSPNIVIPVMQISGTADDVVPMDGSMGYVSEGWGGAPDIYTVMNFWSNLHGCSDEETTNWQFDYSTDLTKYFNCNNDSSELRLYVANGMGHTWPSFAEEQIWDFFMQVTSNNTVINEATGVHKRLLRSIDILGRETNKKGFKMDVFNDGSIKKNYVFD